MSNYYRINSPAVISEQMDDEYVVINLDSGCYYNLNQTSGVIWSLLGDGYSVEKICDFFIKSTDIETTLAEEMVNNHIAILLEEHLLVPCDGCFDNDIIICNDKANERFVLPKVEKFTDMQDMLLLDVIHDVSDRGWPHKK